MLICAINESFNKQFKESFTKYIQSTIIDMFKGKLPTVCKFYSLNPKPFHNYQSETNHKKKVVAKSQKLKIEQFIRLDFLNIRFYSKNKKTELPYSHFIRICGPVFCCCSTFMGLAYCHHTSY